MKTKYLILSILFSVILISKTTAQWTQTNGPLGGRVYCVEKVGNEIWAGTITGIYTSDNEGLSWQKSTLIDGFCFDIHSKNDTILILYNVYEPDSFENWITYSIASFNGGNSWGSPVYAFTTFGGFYHKMVKIQHTYIFSDHNTYWKTGDYGQSWTVISPTNQFGFSWLWAIDPIVIVSANDSGFTKYYLSNDQCDTWQQIYSVYNNPMMEYFDNSVFLLGQYTNVIPLQRKILRSIDLGNTWDSVFVSPQNVSFSSFCKKNDSLFIFTNKLDTNYVSIDNGLTWNFINSRPNINYFYGDTVNVSNGDFIASSNIDAIVRHDVSQDSIFPTNSGLGLKNINLLKSYQGVLYASEGLSSNNSLYYSGNEGQTWNKLNLPNPNGYPIKDFWCYGDTILVATAYELLKSFNNGLSWTNTNNPDNMYFSDWGKYPYLDKLNNRIFYSGDSLYYSDDIGVTWSTLPLMTAPVSGPCANSSLYCTGKIFISNNEVYSLVNHRYLFKFNPIANNWQFITCDLDFDVFQIVDNIFIGKTWEDSLIVSLDFGTSWQHHALNGLPIDNSYVVFPTNIISANGTWFGIVNSSYQNFGVYTSLDQGRNWQSISNNNLFQTNCITSLNGVLYAGAYYNSIWRRSGNFNLISGKVYRDLNQNGIQETGELGIPGIIIKMVTAGTVATTDVNGNYSILTDVTGDTLKPVLPVTFSSSIPGYYISNGAATNKDFGIYLTPGIADLSIDLTNNIPFRPGFNTTLQLTVFNHGSLIQSPNIQLTLDTSLTYISSSISPSSIIGNIIQWNTSSIDFSDVQNIDVTVSTSVTSSIGDTVHCSATVSPIISDINPTDNYSGLAEIIVGSFDPNDKKCIQGNYFTPEQAQSGEELEYVIRFQNTGTYLATNIHVSDTLNSYLDFSTFRVISSSHQMSWSLNGNAVVDFNFNGVNLPPALQDEINSHGFVKYGIKCKQGIAIGNVITNTANIYFDFNQPIITNTTTTAIAYSTLLQIEPEALKENPNISILVYPNPTSEKINLNISGYKNNDLTVFVYSTLGALIKQNRLSEITNSIDFIGLSDGIYYGTIINSNNKKIADFKFVIKNQ